MKDRFPFHPFPKGWFQVAYSEELWPGQLMPLKYFGKDLVLFRGEDCVAHVLDAHCPHLGAHLGYGGAVEGNAIKCPFHAWKFDGNGTCVEVPYANKVPPLAKMKPWHVHEVNGLIMVWHDPEGGAPTWEVPAIPEYGNEDWTQYEKRRWTIRTRNQEMAENAVDSAHFLYVHGAPEKPVTTAEARGHILHVLSTTKYITPRGPAEGSVEVDAYGFGFTLTRFRGIVETLLVSSATAIDDQHVDIRFSFTIRSLGSASTTKGVGRAFLSEIERQLEQDIPIWENKVYFNRPLLCDGDGPIGLYRRWIRQFYPAASLAATPEEAFMNV